jgi:hypothetical protein
MHLIQGPRRPSARPASSAAKNKSKPKPRKRAVKKCAGVKRDDGFESVHFGVKRESEDEDEDDDESEEEEDEDEEDDEWEDIGRKPRKKKIDADWQDVNVREELASQAEKMYLEEGEGEEKSLREKVSAAARVASKKVKEKVPEKVKNNMPPAAEMVKFGKKVFGERLSG